MRAVVVREFGAPDVLAIEDRPEPTPGAGEVAIEVAYAGVNYAEIMGRRGLLPLRPPFVPGLEVSGVVRARGSGVDHVQVGAPVCALTFVGGYAEVAIAKAALVFPLASDSDDALRAGAARPTIVPTAWALIHELARVQAGDVVVIHAAAGGVGTVAGQVAQRSPAALVIGVVSSDAKARYASRFGYDEVIAGPDWVQRVRSLTADRGPEVILDSVGGDVRSCSLELLRPMGRLVIFGNASGASEDDLPGRVLRTQAKAVLGWSITGLAAVDADRVAAIARPALAAADRGEIGIDITDVQPLEQAGAVHERLENRRTMGKLLLRVGGA